MGPYCFMRYSNLPLGAAQGRVLNFDSRPFLFGNTTLNISTCPPTGLYEPHRPFVRNASSVEHFK
jgi:hypothetical protein